MLTEGLLNFVSPQLFLRGRNPPSLKLRGTGRYRNRGRINLSYDTESPPWRNPGGTYSVDYVTRSRYRSRYRVNSFFDYDSDYDSRFTDCDTYFMSLSCQLNAYYLSAEKTDPLPSFLKKIVDPKAGEF